MSTSIIQLFRGITPVRFVPALLLFGLSANTEAQAQNFWRQTNGPTGGEINAFAINNSNGYIFAGTLGGGVFRSMDNGDNWTEVSTDLTNKDIKALATNSSGYIFAAYRGGVFRSKNNGDNWSPVNTGLKNAGTSSFAINNSNGYIFAGSADSGVFRSMNTGDNWMAVNTGLTNIKARALAVNLSGHIFAGTDGGGVFRSLDNGDNWTPVNTGLTNVQSLAINSSGHIFAGTASSGVFRSMDNGDNWTPVNAGLTNVQALTINSSGHIFAGTSGGVFRSMDNGGNWMDVLPNKNVEALASNSSEAIFAGTLGGGVYRSTDDGNSWEQKNTGLANTEALSLDSNSSGAIFAGTLRGLFRSTNNGGSWDDVTSGSMNNTIEAIAINANGNIFAGTRGGGVYRSTNNGGNWTPVNTGLTNTKVLSLIINNSNGYIFTGTDGGGVFRSTDNASSWMATGPTNTKARALAINSSGHIFAGTLGGVFRSMDNGGNWKDVNSGLNNTDVRALAINSSGHIFAGTEGGGIFRSMNNGDSWMQILTSITVRTLAINSSGHIFAGTFGSGVLRSMNNGSSWGGANTGLTNLSVLSLDINSSGFIFAGTKGNGVFKSMESTAVATFTRITTGDISRDAGKSHGCSWVDYDNDGDLDLFVANKDNQTNFLYQNNGNRNFNRIAAGEIVTDAGKFYGNNWGDYDNDGDLDLFVTRDNQNNFLYRNNGDRTFKRMTASEAGLFLNDRAPSHGCNWGDYDNDGHLDLFVANISDSNNFLYRNKGDRTFEKITTGEIVNDGGDSYSSSWADYDNDGDLDLFVANAAPPNNFLYRNNGDRTFKKMTAVEVDAIVTDRGSFSGSWGDYDNDGDLDLFVARGSNLGNLLYRNDGGRTFKKMIASEVGSIVEDGRSKGSSWGDYDNDGDLDLFVANNFGQNNFLYENNDGRFTKMTDTTKVGSIVSDNSGGSQGCSWGDFDGDGDLDLFVTNFNEADNLSKKNFLYENNGNANHWINILCVGTVSNRAAIGAKVRVKATIKGKSVWQMREISGQTGAYSQNSLNAEFGLGEATVIDSLKIEWPSGIIQVLTNQSVNRFLTITESSSPNPPTIFKNPDSLNFKAAEGGANPPSQILQIRNGGGGILNWNVSDNQPWLSLSPANGSSISEIDTVTVSVDITNLSAGTHIAVITISSPGATNTPQTTPVILTVERPLAPDIFLVASDLTFVAIEGGLNPQPKILEISNKGNADLRFSLEKNEPWLSLQQAGPVTLDPGETIAIETRADISGLAAGNYTASIAISSNDPDDPQLRVPAFLEISGSPSVATNSATKVSDTSATLNGTVNPNGFSTTVGFAYGVTTSYGNTVTINDSLTGKEEISVSASVTRLQPETTYHYQVFAENGAGRSFGADRTFTTGNRAPTAITNPATNVSTTSAALNGTVNPHGLETTVKFEFGTTTIYQFEVPAAQSPLTGTNETSVNASVSGLSPGTEYHYRVVATNSAGSMEGADRTFFTIAGNQAPFAPTLASPSENTFIKDNIPALTFNVPQDANGDALHFKVEIDDDGNFGADTQSYESRTNAAGFNPTPPVTQGAGQMTYTVQSALAEGDWWWRVSAWDGQVFGSLSEVRKFVLDVTQPFTSGHNPARGSIGVAVNTNIIVQVRDAGSGVKRSALVMKVNGNVVSPAITGTVSDYTITYDPPTNFDYQQIVNVSLDAADSAGNAMATDTYSFTTASPGNSAPAAPTLVSPATNTFMIDNTPSLAFNVSSDPNDDPLHFKVEIAADSNFSTGNQVFESKNSTNGFSPTPPVAQGSGQVTFTLSLPLVDGAWWWRVSAWDGQIYGDASSPFRFYVDTTPPQVSHTAVTTALTGTSVAIAASLSDNLGVIQSAKLYYRAGGAASFDSTNLNNAGGSNYQGTIPMGALTTRGVEYYFSVQDRVGNTRTFPLSNAKARPQVTQVTSNNLAFASPTPPRAYRMISVPFDLDNSSVPAVLEELGTYDDRQWRLLRWLNDKYLEYTLNPDLPSFEAGNGFWLITKESKILDAGAGKSVTTAENFKITLPVGWSQIGNPFAFSVNWSEVSKPASIENNLVGYSGNTNMASGYDYARTQLVPFEGYFVNNLGPQPALIEIPPKSASGTAVTKQIADWKSALQSNEWALQITATAGRYLDKDNYVGGLNAANDEWDGNDFSEAPFLADHVSLYFPHVDWNTFPGNYTVDFRAINTEGGVWKFEVQSSLASVTLALAEQINLPADWQIMLLDKSSQIAWDWNAREQYTFVKEDNEEIRSFHLVVGKSSFVEKNDLDLKGLPQSFSLSQNYPNPFNPETRFDYEVPVVSRVRIVIYNLRGQEIRRLLEATKSVGRYLIVWNGKTEEGTPAVSGVYLVRMIANDYVSVRKIVLAR